jgi:hypothetical protein
MTFNAYLDCISDGLSKRALDAVPALAESWRNSTRLFQ